MGFDIKSFIQDVQRAMGNHPDVKVDDNFSEGEKKALPSIFGAKSMVENAVAKGDLSAADAKAIFGLEISDTQGAKAPRRAGEGDGEVDHTESPKPGVKVIYYKNGTIKIEINSEVNIVMDFNLGPAIKDQVTKILNQYFDGLKLNLEQMFNDIKTNINNLFAYISGIYMELNKLGKLDEIINILNELSVQINEQTENINNLGVKIDGFENMVKQMFNQLMNKIERQGFQIDYLVKLAEENAENNEQQNEMLAKIYVALNQLSTQFGEHRNDVKNYYNVIAGMLQKGNIKLDEMMALLNIINSTSNETKNNTIEILKLVAEGNKEILSAIANLDQKFTQYGDEIKAKMTSILLELNKQGKSIDEIKQKLADFETLLKTIDTTTKDTNKDTKQIKEDTTKILELLKDFPDFVSTIKDLLVKMDGKLDKIREFLEQMETNNKKRHTEVMNMLQQILDKDIKVDFTEVLTAIADLSAQSADQYEGLSNQSKSEFEALKELIEKIPGGGECNCKDYTAMLEQILTAIGDLSSQVDDFKTDINKSINNLMQSITNLTNYTQNIEGAVVDLSGKLDEILGAIKDHHVTVTLTHDEADPDKIKWTYVDCLHQTEEQQAPGARRASGFATTPEQAREYEMLLNFGTTHLNAEQEAKFNEAQAHRPKVSGGTTGIAGVEADLSNYEGPVYDLQGRKVADNCANDWNRLPKGMYAIKGKTYIKK